MNFSYLELEICILDVGIACSAAGSKTTIIRHLAIDQIICTWQEIGRLVVKGIDFLIIGNVRAVILLDGQRSPAGITKGHTSITGPKSMS